MEKVILRSSFANSAHDLCCMPSLRSLITESCLVKFKSLSWERSKIRRHDSNKTDINTAVKKQQHSSSCSGMNSENRRPGAGHKKPLEKEKESSVLEDKKTFCRCCCCPAMCCAVANPHVLLCLSRSQLLHSPQALHEWSHL